MPSFEKEESVELSDVITVKTDVSPNDFMNACSDTEVGEVLFWLKIEGHLDDDEVNLPFDGSNSDEELNGFLTKISDARMRLTNEDLEDLNRIACKYR